MVENIRRGSQIYIEWEIRDQTAEHPPLVDPDTVEITLIDPSGTTAAGPANMTKKRVGIYFYLFQSLETHEAGAWLSDIKVTQGGAVVYARLKTSFNLTTK
jgi:hypothetical protein